MTGFGFEGRRGAAARSRGARNVSRRSVLRGLGAAVVVPAMADLLSACGTQLYTSGHLVLASPDHPVRWPYSTKHKPIEPGQTPERGSTLRIYNYADYLGPGVIKDFEQKYDVKVTVSTFNDGDEALTKVASGAVPYDLYFPSYDQIGKLVAADLIRPLTHEYIPNISNLWPQFLDPWYDRGWRYTVPYTVYSTGIGWRTDMVDFDVSTMENPYDLFWDPANRGNVAVIDDFHTTMALVLLRHGITDVNTAKVADLDLIRSDLSAMQKATDPRVTVTMYNDLPAGQYGISLMWGGDAVNAQYYLPKHVSPDVLRYWVADGGLSLVDNDLMALPATGQNPVAAHFFINHMLDPVQAAKNFGYIGYQPPQKSINPTQLVSDGFVTPALETTAVSPKDFKTAGRLLELNPVVDSQWHEIWQAYKANG